MTTEAGRSEPMSEAVRRALEGVREVSTTHPPTHADWEAVRYHREFCAGAIVVAVRERRWKDATLLVKAYDAAVAWMHRLDEEITARENAETR